MAIKNKKRMLRSKRGVSPLIATVLLIAFAVALGAVVMNWGRGYVEDTANTARESSDKEVKCASDVDINIVEIDSVPQICYNTSFTTDNTSIEFIVENKKSTNVEKIEARIIAVSSRVPLIYDLGDSSNLSTNVAKLLNFSYDDDSGAPAEVKLTPYIRVGNSDEACPSSSETITNIKPCAEVWS